jgi:hypothetical protein
MIMKERPILFSGPMVRAIIDGRKTMTRRVAKTDGLDLVGSCGNSATGDVFLVGRDWVGNTVPVKCPYGLVGDRLWVRETWGNGWTSKPVETDALCYKATPLKDQGFKICHRWRPSIHMPRWASRITLEITAVRVERLQDITEEDAQKEGVESVLYCEERFWRAYGHNPLPGGGELTATRDAKRSFQTLWSSINGPDSWASNPWVWVIEFRRVQP